MTDPSDIRGEWPVWVREWVLPYLDDSILWPVLFALLAHVVVVIVPLMLQIQRTGSSGAVLMLASLLVGTGWLVRMEYRALRRFRALTWVLVVMWVVSVPIAWFVGSTGLM